MSLTGPPLVSAEPPKPYRHLQAAQRQAARPCCPARSSTRSSFGADSWLAWRGAGQVDPRGRARDGVLHRHGQHGPPTPGPCRRSGASHGWRSSLGSDTDEVSDQLAHTGISPSADLTPEHHELLGGRRSIPGTQLSVGARRPARRLHRVQQHRVAGELCLSAATRVWRRSTEPLRDVSQFSAMDSSTSF